MFVIEKKQIKNWLKKLKEDFSVKDVRQEILPFKKYLLPPQEVIFELDKKSGKLKSHSFEERLLLFGLSVYDLEALNQLDEIMRKPEPDYFYEQRRRKAVIVGLSEFSLEGVVPGGDLMLEKINSRQYSVQPLNRKGREIIKGDFFQEVKEPQIKKYPAPKNPLRPLLLDSELLAEAVAWSWSDKHQIWDELAKKCLGCGNCTYVCPICHCFAIEDRVTLEGEQCLRYRQWDACTLPRFAQIAGGHNFHKTIKERYYNWFYHKFVRAYKQYGRAQCVGCGRCRENCPAGISIYEVLKEIVADYQKTNPRRQSET